MNTKKPTLPITPIPNNSYLADETICTDCDALLEFLQEKNHPVLSLEPLM